MTTTPRAATVTNHTPTLRPPGDQRPPCPSADMPVKHRPVAEVMSRSLLVVEPSESTLLAWEILRRSGYRHLPVVNAQGHCVGMLDAIELAIACANAHPLSPTPVDLLVRERRVSTVRSSDSIATAAHTMVRENVTALPVTDDHGLLVGLLSASDIVRAVAGLHHREPCPTTAGPVLFRLEPALPDRSAPTEPS
jgi:CBS domain-containing protein